MDRFFEDTALGDVLRGITGLGKELGGFLGQHLPVVACVAVALILLWRWTMPSTR